MHQVPVFATIRRSYLFVFSNLGLLYRLAWLPIAIYALLPAAIGAALTSVGPMKPPDLSRLAVTGIAIIVVTTILNYFLLAVAAVAFHRVILFGDRQPRPTAVFAVELPVVYFAALPLAVQLASLTVAVLATLLLGFPAGHTVRLSGGQGFLAATGFLVAMWVVVWIAGRLAPLYPLIVATNRFDLREAWSLSRGNVWRIIGVFILGNLPLLFILMALGTMIAQPLTGGMVSVDMGSPQTAAPLVGSALAFVVTIPVMALNVALVCFCFKAIVGVSPGHLFVPPVESRRD